MNVWEALAAIGSIASAIVIALTVIFAARQVRATLEQLEQVRRANQFDAARTVLLEFADPKFVAAYRFVFHELPTRLQDESYVHGAALIGFADESEHQELIVFRALDRIGAYVRYGLVDGAIAYTSYAWRIVHCWEALAPIVAIHRTVADQHFWENVEFLYDDCRRWLHESGREIGFDPVLGRATRRDVTPLRTAGSDA